jgi:hypothetical protein
MGTISNTFANRKYFLLSLGKLDILLLYGINILITDKITFFKIWRIIDEFIEKTQESG